MIIKVCGIKTQENAEFLSLAEIDMIGLNFYEPSVRYISDDVDPGLFDTLPDQVQRVGVFVNESIATILEKKIRFRLDLIQLHGDEGPEFCGQLATFIPVIKVFRIGEDFDFRTIRGYDTATYFLFDTQTRKYGGSGRKFDWTQLDGYLGNIPFLLSGGIGPDDIDQVLSIHHPQFSGIDINSKFESKPGIKDRNLVLPFINRLKIK